MNENIKTLTFVVAAGAVALIAWASNPTLRTAPEEDVRNTPLYPEFTNPQSVASLEIVKYDEKRGTIQRFKVARVERKGKTRWSIPSHDDYPADAKEQVAAAATSLMGLKIVNKVTNNAGEQAQYGVVDPDPKALKLGAVGVGDRVVMKDDAGKEQLALVIGKEVPGDGRGLRYVRKADETAIYIVDVKTDKLSTKFEDWIEPDLLKINTMDLNELLIHDYSIKMTLDALALIQSDKIRIAYNDAAKPYWKMLDDQQFVADDKADVGGKWQSVAMKPDEELNVAKLDELKSALENLKIVDVSRKPAGLRDDLKVAADFASNRDAVESLASKGFFAVSGELYSNEGEIRLAMKSGVVYVLRFGQIAGAGSATKDAKKDKDKGKEKKATGLNRYLFVMAEFDPSAIAKPQFELPPSPDKAKEPEKKPDGEKKADATKPADGKTAAKKTPEEKADAKNLAADKKADDAELARIEKDNKRKREEYDRHIAEGKKRVADLNARFADWYYVISDEVYQKIHLSHDDIVMKKPKKAAGKDGQGKGEIHVDHASPAEESNGPGTPMSDLEKLKQEGPAGK
jgi:hypothetical protein